MPHSQHSLHSTGIPCTVLRSGSRCAWHLTYPEMIEGSCHPRTSPGLGVARAGEKSSGGNGVADLGRRSEGTSEPWVLQGAHRRGLCSLKEVDSAHSGSLLPILKSQASPDVTHSCVCPFLTVHATVDVGVPVQYRVSGQNDTHVLVVCARKVRRCANPDVCSAIASCPVGLGEYVKKSFGHKAIPPISRGLYR